MATGKISSDEWLRELARVTLHNAEGFTMHDVARVFDIGESHAYRRIRDWMRRGQVELVGPKRFMAATGRESVLSAYRVTKQRRLKQ